MRKYFTVLLVAAMAMVLGTSCRGPQGRPGHDGVITHRAVIDIQVNDNEWSYSNKEYQYDGNYFYADINVPELTGDAYNNGIVKIYREYNTGTQDAYQIELPYIHDIEAETGGDWVFFHEKVDFDYMVGSVRLYYNASDFSYEEPDKQGYVPSWSPEAMHFRMVIVW